MTTLKIDSFSIGGESANNVTRRYVIGHTADGFLTAEPYQQPAPREARSIERVLHHARVTMPRMYPGTPQEAVVWRRNEILAHYGLEAGQEA